MTNPLNKVPSQEKSPKETILIIDDDKRILESLKHFFGENKNIITAECHSVDEALKAIGDNDPGLIFLDNSLSGEGVDDGLEVVDQLEGQGIKIYSTTINDRVVPQYTERGIEMASKMDLSKIRSIIAEFTKNKKT